jgi:formylglycine-generating enzyme required for sulfatase activity
VTTANLGAARVPIRLAVRFPRLFACILAAACCLSASESKAEEREQATPPAADPMLGKEAGDVRDDNGLKMKLVWCPRGFFNMEKWETEPEQVAGDDARDDEDIPDNPRRRQIAVKVYVSAGYWLGRYEVTQGDWREIMATEPWKGYRLVREGDDYPAAATSWNDATAFCEKLTTRERKAGRLPDGWEYTLPTEAQWERACRARTQTAYSFGDDAAQIGDYAWWGGHRGNGNTRNEQYPHRVGQKKPNPWGLYDMHGNVQEWCRDTLVGDPPGGRDPEVTATSSLRICRGGNWQLGPDNCRSGYRCGNKPDFRAALQGLRVALCPVRTAGITQSGAESPSAREMTSDQRETARAEDASLHPAARACRRFFLRILPVPAGLGAARPSGNRRVAGAGPKGSPGCALAGSKRPRQP